MSYAASLSEDDNIGSLREINLALKNWISSIDPVAFNSPYAWETIDFLPGSASIKDSSADSANGPEYTYSVVFAFNKQNTALYDTFKKYLTARGIMQCTDNNGLTRIIGTPEYPVTFTHDADTGQQYADMNYFKVTATWISSEPAVVV